MTSAGLSPMTSYTDGLGLLPSADSLYQPSVRSLSITTSNCTISSSLSQTTNGEDGTRGRSRTKTMRTQEIEKSPVPHRFHLVPSGNKRRHHPGKRADLSPRPTQWTTFKEPQAETESIYSATSPNLYDTDADVYSPKVRISCEADKRQLMAIIGGRMSDALESPVFDSFRPPAVSPDYVSSSDTHSFSGSFTLVQEQPSNRSSKRYSSSSKAQMEAFDESVRLDVNLSESGDVILPLGPASWETRSRRNLSRLQDDISIPAGSGTAMDSASDDSQLPLLDMVGPSENNALPAVSLSNASLFSQRSRDIILAPSSESTGSLSRRATDGSLGSPYSSDRRFALRRQAIYADSGFQIAFPESDSESSLRHSAPRESSRKPKMGHTPRSASAYAFSASAPRSTWSTSTSGASLISETERDLDTAHPPCHALNLGQANERLERLSVPDDLLASNRNMLLGNDCAATASLPTDRSCGSLSELEAAYSPTCGLSPSVSGSTSIAATNDGVRRTPWAPLRFTKRHSTDPLVLCVPWSASDRSERFAAWREDPEHHRVIKALLEEVDRTMHGFKTLSSVEYF